MIRDLKVFKLEIIAKVYIVRSAVVKWYPALYHKSKSPNK